MQPNSFESLASDRATWRALFRDWVDDFEHSRQKERVAAPGSFPCDRRPRV